MSDYTPTTEQVRDGFRYDPIAEYHDPLTPHHIYGGQAFDRWLAAHDRQVKAEALRQYASDCSNSYMVASLHERAARIEAADV